MFNFSIIVREQFDFFPQRFTASLHTNEAEHLCTESSNVLLCKHRRGVNRNRRSLIQCTSISQQHRSWHSAFFIENIGFDRPEGGARRHRTSSNGTKANGAIGPPSSIPPENHPPPVYPNILKHCRDGIFLTHGSLYMCKRVCASFRAQRTNTPSRCTRGCHIWA